MPMVYLESASTDPAFNLALEQYVFDSMPRSNEYFMLWQNDNAIIVGRHQNTAEEINADYVREHGIRVVRRLSGGGAVYHDLGNLNFTFIVDAEHADRLNLQVFCLPVVRALERLGVRAEISGRNDITIGGKKFSGNSQYIREGRIMHHGTLMFDSDLSVVAGALNPAGDKLASKGVKSVRSRVTNIRPWLNQDITLRQFWDLLRRSMGEERDMLPGALTEDDLRRVTAIRDTRYAAWEWNFGASPGYSIRKERRVEGCGKLQVFLEVERGKIAGFTVRGDYFGSGDSSDLARALTGCPLKREALNEALRAVPIDYYFSSLTPDQFIDILLQ